MKFNIFHTTGLFILVLMLRSNETNALQNDTSESHYNTAKTELNVRKGPGKNYTLLFTLEEGEEVAVVSTIGDWYKIEVDGRTEFVRSKFLKRVGQEEDGEIFSLTKLLKGNIFIIVILAGLIYLIYIMAIRYGVDDLRSVFVENSRGTPSERKLVRQLARYGIPKEKIFHDLFVEKQPGHFSQLDVVAVTDVGIIVFEVKDFRGWIYGSAGQQKWTKVLNYGKEKYRFYNPILQNAKHVTELKKHLINYSYIPVFSVIVFYGDCEIKEIDFVPKDTFVAYDTRVRHVMDKIMAEYPRVYYSNETSVMSILQNAVVNGADPQNQMRHISNIKDMLGEDRVFLMF